jgi:predicted transcriptional regulator
MHKEQLNILKNLMFNPDTTFSKLNTNTISSDRFNFHIKQLSKNNLLTKNNSGLYSLTEKGKELVLRLDSATKTVPPQSIVGVVVVPTKIIKGTKHYLLQKRLKSPFYGVYGPVSGKVELFEFASNAAKRELKEETGLFGGNMNFLGIHHSVKGHKKTT